MKLYTTMETTPQHLANIICDSSDEEEIFELIQKLDENIMNEIFTFKLRNYFNDITFSNDD